MNKVNASLVALTAGVGLLSFTTFVTFSHISKLEQRAKVAETRTALALRLAGQCVVPADLDGLKAKDAALVKAAADLNLRLRRFERNIPINARGHKEKR